MNMDKIKVFIVEKDITVRNEIEEMLSNVEYITLAGEADSMKSTTEQMARNTVDVLLIGAVSETDKYAVSEKLCLEFPETAIIMLEERLTEETMHKAFVTGAKDVIIKPVIPSKLVDSIYNVHQSYKTKSPVRKETNPRVKSGLGQVYTVFSTKGGVGKTFVSVNLAVALAKLTSKRVALVDLDLDFGNAALALNILPKYTVIDVVDEIKNIDSNYIENYLIPHDSGIKVLPANAQPMVNEFVNAEDIDIILKTVRSVFDYVVVDMPGRFYKPVNSAFALADKLIIVTTPEMASIRNVKASLAVLKDLNYPRSKIRLLLNKASRNDSVKLKDIEATLNYDVFASLKADYKEANYSMNVGIPLLSKKTAGILSKDIKHFTKKLIEESETKKNVE